MILANSLSTVVGIRLVYFWQNKIVKHDIYVKLTTGTTYCWCSKLEIIHTTQNITVVTVVGWS